MYITTVSHPFLLCGFSSPFNYVVIMDKALISLEKKAKRIKRIQAISNTILANACYHTKEMDNQIKMAIQQGDLSKEEENIIRLAWDLRNKLANELMIEYKKYLGGNNGENKT